MPQRSEFAVGPSDLSGLRDFCIGKKRPVTAKKNAELE
jgi:hypothetical protein